MIILGISLALVCALTTNLAFLYKHRGANEAPAVSMTHPLRSAAGLFKSRWFAIGMAVAVFAWVFHVAAMAVAPISLVQAVLSGGVVLLAILAERFFGFEVGPRQWAGVALTAGGLILLGISLPASEGSHSSFSTVGMIAFQAGMVAVGALLVMGPRMGARAHHHGLMLGAASGILFGVSDVAIKAVTGLLATDGMAGFLSPWVLVAVVASIAAFYASARGLQTGDAVPVIAITSTAATISCISGGIIVFGDPMAGDALGIVVQFAAFAMVALAAWLTPAPLRAAGTPA